MPSNRMFLLYVLCLALVMCDAKKKNKDKDGDKQLGGPFKEIIQRIDALEERLNNMAAEKGGGEGCPGNNVHFFFHGGDDSEEADGRHIHVHINNDKMHETSNETGPCHHKLREVRERLAQEMVLGLEEPQCDEDGNFQPIQFVGSAAKCVTKDGIPLEYTANRWETDGMHCKCARDQHDYQKTGLVGKIFSCAPNGNYALTQCMGSSCYCTDSMGKKVGSSTVHISKLDTIQC